MQKSGQRVVITGAGSGLGRELALRYAQEGARLALADEPRMSVPGVFGAALDRQSDQATPGEFVVPPTKAEEMYHPETFGRSASDRVNVVD